MKKWCLTFSAWIDVIVVIKMSQFIKFYFIDHNCTTYVTDVRTEAMKLLALLDTIFTQFMVMVTSFL